MKAVCQICLPRITITIQEKKKEDEDIMMTVILTKVITSHQPLLALHIIIIAAAGALIITTTMAKKIIDLLQLFRHRHITIMATTIIIAIHPLHHLIIIMALLHPQQNTAHTIKKSSIS